MVFYGSVIPTTSRESRCTDKIADFCSRANNTRLQIKKTITKRDYGLLKTTLYIFKNLSSLEGINTLRLLI